MAMDEIRTEAEPETDERVLRLIDRRWRSLMAQGNVAFRSGDMREAIAFYDAGLVEAERLLKLALESAAPAGYRPAAALVVAASNAANTHVDCGRSQKAEDVMGRAIKLLREAMEDEAAPKSVRLDCLKHVSRALAELARHMRQSGTPPTEFAERLNQARCSANICLTANNDNSFH